MRLGRGRGELTINGLVVCRGNAGLADDEIEVVAESLGGLMLVWRDKAA